MEMTDNYGGHPEQGTSDCIGLSLDIEAAYQAWREWAEANPCKWEGLGKQ